MAPEAEASAVLESFIDRIGAPDKQFEASQQGWLRIGDRTTGLFTYDLAVAGDNAKATVRIGTTEATIIVIGDRAWIQQATGDWIESTRAEVNGDDIVDVFRYLGDPAELAFVGIDTGGVDRQFHFRPTRPIPYETAQIRESGGTGQIVKMDVYILPSGEPLRVDFEFEASVPGGADVSGSAFITFLNWGKRVEIRAP